jgi:uncharacterized lipoprotein YehR (DUF1307 family)
MKKFNRALCVICAFVLAFCLVALAGCADKSEETITNAITQQFDGYKNKDAAVMTELEAAVETVGLDNMGIDAQEFAAVLLDGFDYSITGVTVDGTSATATISITSKDFSNLSSDLAEVAADVISNVGNYADLTQDEITAKVAAAAVEKMKSAPVTTKEGCTINYTLEDDTWVVDESTSDSLSDIILGS